MTSNAAEKPFDFDDWANLAHQDPEAFEARRAELIEEFLAAQPEERRLRLRRLQWRIDRERERSRTPLAACIRLSKMMWDSVAGRRGLVESLAALQGRPGALAPPMQRAVVLRFPDRRH